jgi:HSP20 family molecular chaperone IbpA
MQEEKKNWRDRQWLEYSVWRSTRPFVPPTDVIEFEDKVLILVEAAALRPTDLTITLLDDRLVIAGTRERPALQNGSYHQVEIGYGEFRVEVALQWSIQRDGVSAAYRDGLLEVELPRLPKSQIPVNDHSKDSE